MLGLNIILFVVAACFEILGCYLMYRFCLGRGAEWWTAVGAVFSLTAFAVLLLFEYKAGETGRTYLIYAGIYALVSMAWLSLYERVPLSLSDCAGSAMILAGCFVVYKQVLS